MGFVSAVISLGSHSGFKCVIQMDHDYLAFLIWLALWLSLCNIGDQPGLLSQAGQFQGSSRCHKNGLTSLA